MTPVYIDIQNVFDYLKSDKSKLVAASIPPWDNARFVFRAYNFTAFYRWQPLVTVQSSTLRMPPAFEPNTNKMEWLTVANLFLDNNHAATCKQYFDKAGKPGGDSEVTYDQAFLTSTNGMLSDYTHFEVYSSFFYVFWFAIQLAHCKNVELIDQPLTRQQQRRKERKGEIYYKVLAIEPSKKQIRNEAAANGQNEIDRALHICRGHFVTYTEDKPLFGKHAGTFWKPQHLRGKRAAGLVVKDYEVKP